MKSKAVKTLLAFLLLLPILTHAALAQEKRHRIVFAMTSPEEADWRLTIGNIRNLLSAYPPNTADVEVVTYGPGLNMVKKGSPVEADVASLQLAHVRFVACEHTMQAQHVTLAELLKGLETVPSGVVEVVTRQEQGWSYIKAGR